MDFGAFVLLLVAGVIGGVVNALAGGATLITFPAMMMAGLSPVVANASNSVAISPGHFLAAIADRGKLFQVQLGRRCCLAAIGGAGGAAILLVLPERLFTLPVPALIGFATLLFGCAPRLQRATLRPRAKHSIWEDAILLAVSVYGGFFGAGLGIMLTAIVSLGQNDDIRLIKAVKNLLATAVSVPAIVIFGLKGGVAWTPTAVMLVGAIVGGYAGGHLIRILPAGLVRRAVIVAGTGMTVIYGVRYWA
ncbi:sulfite exporter TauE/SafE family protein [Telmatospirillum sp.]|uniref:sulfite exporter TauE/SafE family protein n=1 Tax=Telmatospirillum sp. TaxID=2079197 RepID=UPI00284BDDFC|nr:sulfite exporter TauE/SafE family protein [Telmatospirillum sp.]MDR3437896.1 sulfite exporter TauE/SafE family protein [Telmatospirillum sp.]